MIIEHTETVLVDGLPTTITGFGKTKNSAKVRCIEDCRKYVSHHQQQRDRWKIEVPRTKGLKVGYVPLSESTVLQIKGKMKELKLSQIFLSRQTNIKLTTLNMILSFNCKSIKPENLEKIKLALRNES